MIVKSGGLSRSWSPFFLLWLNKRYLITKTAKQKNNIFLTVHTVHCIKSHLSLNPTLCLRKCRRLYYITAVGRCDVNLNINMYTPCKFEARALSTFHINNTGSKKIVVMTQNIFLFKMSSSIPVYKCTSDPPFLHIKIIYRIKELNWRYWSNLPTFCVDFETIRPCLQLSNHGFQQQSSTATNHSLTDEIFK